jgi:hypothetical protein
MTLPHGETEDQSSITCHNFTVHLHLLVPMVEKYGSREAALAKHGIHMVSDAQYDFLIERAFGKVA